MPNRNNDTNPEDGRQARSFSQGSAGSYLNSWLSGRFSPSTSANYLEGDDETGDLEGNDDEANQRGQPMSIRLRKAGGVNSLDNFARSWQRAAAFPEIIPRRSSFVFEYEEPGEADEGQPGQDHTDQKPATHPLLSASYRSGRQRFPSDSVLDGTSNRRDSSPPDMRPLLSRESPTTTTTADLLRTYDASSFGRSFGTSYGSISSRVSETTRQRALELYRPEHHPVAGGEPDPDREPLLVKQIQHEDGTKENVIVGHSTVPQTIFNSVNVLIGVGLLSLPLGMNYAGWVPGLLFLGFSAAVTAYTAKVLAKCMDVDHHLVTYGDLAYISFGHRARVITSLLFCLELLGACVALVVLFGDSLGTLLPGLSLTQWKIVCGIILLPLSFVPLRFLSVTSILGILSCTSIVGIVLIDGLVKKDSPGSLLQPAKTSLFPENWATLPLSFGLIMSPWGGHGVFPNIYRDMRHPHKYGRSLVVTYIFTYSLDCSMAVIGWLMFGDGVRDEIIVNILQSTGYPRALSIGIIVFTAIIPITKVPLK
ncbi:transporter, putative [Talaromyces stipitatus ATCC 10500]|uniref:Transporter, putative n=1 Tax=Talaromyces stipitatus (strain ATCC 10500 / CBS 375.48 / QM 6759 / NRRL 1006) TaxID=441959 RepID=B8MBZ5_TALSN|nr:transporter, putative [Talaromyces stipitatus ATCC 10500]EED18441.1 transporter, putative [Talaromyces stipitatus ATCC 10500]